MTTSRFRPPQQHRSQETLDRILDAAEHVLDAKSFSEATRQPTLEAYYHTKAYTPHDREGQSQHCGRGNSQGSY